MIQESRYVIAVPNLENSAQFYKDVLGFEVIEIGDKGWRIFKKDQACIMAGECPEAIPPSDLGDHSYFAYFIVESIDEYFENIKAAGCKILKEVRNEPWGMREFAIQTIDGHRIMVGSNV
jgi:predicted enzyme related to lactoylglutathione lyase